MKQLTPQQIADKWSQNLGRSTDLIRQGVQAVREAPGLAAARQKDKYVRRVQERADKWAERVAAVSLQTWQQTMLSKAIPIIGSRAELAKPKFARFMAEWMQYQQSVATQLAGLPRGTLDQNIARAVFVIRANSQFRQLQGAGQVIAGVQQFLGG